MIRYFCAVVVTFFATQTVSQEFSADLSAPTNRYVREAQSALTLSRWEDSGIKLDIIGDVSAEDSFTVASYLQTLSIYSETELELTGPVEDWFRPGLKVSSQANYLVLFEDFSSLDLSKGSLLQRKAIEYSIEDVSPDVREVFSSGLVKAGPGCYGRWKASDENVVQAFVLAVDNSQPKFVQKLCLNFGIVTSLGVHPVTTKFEFDIPEYGGVKGRPDFSDESQVIMLIQLSAYCRKTMLSDSLQCPADLYRLMLKSYQEQIPR